MEYPQKKQRPRETGAKTELINLEFGNYSLVSENLCFKEARIYFHKKREKRGNKPG